MSDKNENVEEQRTSTLGDRMNDGAMPRFVEHGEPTVPVKEEEAE